MAYPSIYDVTYSYTGFQQSQGNNSFPGTQLDADLNGLESAIDGVSAFMKNVIRSDGKLNNGLVTFDSLSPSLQTAGLTPADAWATGLTYLAKVSVIQAANLYRSTVTHTAGVFATDLAAGKWVLVASLPLAMSLQNGTGAVSRSLNDKIGETFSVTDFGTIGTADDSAIFQAAINAQAAAGGGTVLAPAGTFAVSGLTLPGAVILRGMGKSATTLQSWHTDATCLWKQIEMEA
jgi:hypothetical protein